MTVIGPAIAATSSAANVPLSGSPPVGPAIAATSSAGDVSSTVSTPSLGPAIVATSSAANGVGSATPSIAGAVHSDAPAAQVFASFVLPAETVSAPTIQTLSLGSATAGIGAAPPVASVFSSGSDGWTHLASWTPNELPFTQD